MLVGGLRVLVGGPHEPEHALNLLGVPPALRGDSAPAYLARAMIGFHVP